MLSTKKIDELWESSEHWREFARAVEQSVIDDANKQVAAVPDGFALVPIDPTPEMIDGFWGEIKHGDAEIAAAKECYSAMLSASQAKHIADASKMVVPDCYREKWKHNVMQMWSCVRKHDSRIPSDVLDFMRESLLDMAEDRNSKLLFNGSGHPGVIIAEQSEPKLEMVEPVQADGIDSDTLNELIDDLRAHIATPPHLANEEFIKGCLHSLDTLKLRIKTKREYTSSILRITEQDARDEK